MERKILVAIDGSTYSSNALNYIGRLFVDLDDVHFHLFSVVPIGQLPQSKEWMAESELLNSLSTTARRKVNNNKDYMQTAIRKLGGLGISAERISHEVKLIRHSVAEDILTEARQGLYDALLIGRRGIGKLEEMVMGSISSSILDKAYDVPIWLIDGQVDSRRFLLPVDGSFHSLMAADHIAHILADNPYAEITLFHSSAMFAQSCEIQPQDFYHQWGKKWCEEHLSRPDSILHAPKQILIDNGFPAEKIQWLHTFKGIEAARQILRQALIDDYGTIVLGRRAFNIKKGLFKGVSDRVVFMAEKVAIWVVG